MHCIRIYGIMSILSNCLGFSFSSTHCVCRYLMSHAIGTLKINLYFKGKKGYFVNKTARFSTNIWRLEPKYVLLKRSRYSWDKNECVIYFWVHRIILYFFFFYPSSYLFHVVDHFRYLWVDGGLSSGL